MIGCEMGSMLGMPTLWMGLPGAVLVAGLAAALVLFGRRRSSALAVLEERLAKGEIDVEEFQRRREVLEVSK